MLSVFVPSPAVSLVGRRVGVFVPSPAVSLVGRRVGVFVCFLSGCLLSGT